MCRTYKDHELLRVQDDESEVGVYGIDGVRTPVTTASTRNGFRDRLGQEIAAAKAALAGCVRKPTRASSNFIVEWMSILLRLGKYGI